MLLPDGKELLAIELPRSREAPALGNRAPCPAGAVQTAVELTFSFGIASMQLTPTLEIAALQLRPISNVVTMRLAPSQCLESGRTLEATFEIATVQPTVGGFATVRLAPSQLEGPSIVDPLFFPVAGLEVISNLEAAPIQVTPAQQPPVLVTARFHVANVEFSPSFELAGILLNSSGREAAVQLPCRQSGEDFVRAEISNFQLGSSGEIGMMQLNLVAQAAMPPSQAHNILRFDNGREMERVEDAFVLRA
jgi:hypothetical protein